MTGTSKVANKLATIINKAMEETGCPKLALEWMMDSVLGKFIADNHLTLFKELYDYCTEKGYVGKENGFEYGDMDATIWVENHENYRHVIIIQDHVTCRDDNIMVLVYDDPFYGREDEALTPDMKKLGLKPYHKFLCYNVYEECEREVRYDPPQFNDHRDIEKPALQDVYANEFMFGYGDGRDKGHNFVYDGMWGKTDGGLWKAGRIFATHTNLEIAHCEVIGE
jgi:hypothetical protein